jgi:hypothetical protein
MNTPTGYKAVCFQCAYETEGAGESRCPMCSYPFIMRSKKATEPVLKPDFGLGRAGGIVMPLPLLPGVHRDKRPAQLKQEARTEARRERALQSRVRPVTIERRRGGGTSVAPPVPATSRLAFAFLCVSAVAAGALAAVLQHAL